VRQRGNGGDDQSIANVFESVSGGTTTTVYLQPQASGDYYLSVQASGSWTFNLSETC
jgi:non-ribosomal peptide synthetase component E (peptide arylation enzyme)